MSERDSLDTNIIVCTFDDRAPAKRTGARELVRSALKDQMRCRSHQVPGPLCKEESVVIASVDRLRIASQASLTADVRWNPPSGNLLVDEIAVGPNRDRSGEGPASPGR